MSVKKVVLYFDDQRDALDFTLAAGSVMSSGGQHVPNLVRPLVRATRIRIGRTETRDDDTTAAAS